MSVTASGTARIRHHTTGAVYQIAFEELDWQELAADERQMGIEVGHFAQIDHPDLGELTWELWEYPLGMINDLQVDVGGHILQENFQLSLTNDKDLDEPEVGVHELVEWFGQHFQDPVHETPYNGREGGYQYVLGGPYDARTELYAEFGDAVSAEVIEAAVEYVEPDGILEWAPGPLHPDQQRQEQDYYDGQPPSLSSIVSSLKNGGTEERFGTPNEVEARNALLLRLDDLDKKVERLYLSRLHNGPPEPIAEEFDLNAAKVEKLKVDLICIRQGLASTPPNAEVVGERALAIERGWLGKLDKSADGFFEEFGKEAGKWAGRAAVGAVSGTAIGVVAYASPELAHAIQAVVAAAHHWLAAVISVSTLV